MSEIFHIKVNNEVLIWARESIALGKTKAADKLKISPARLEQLESGKKFPSMDELKSMSKTYKRSIATLLLKSPPQEKPLPKDRRTVNSEDIGKFNEKTILAVRKARAYVSSLVELKKESGFKIDTFNYKAFFSDNPLEIARKLRKQWNLSEVMAVDNADDALEIFIRHLENLGIAIFQLSITQDNLRGFSLTDEVMPVIVLKRGGEYASAKNFTLFHELGHILLNEGGLCDVSYDVESQDIEKWCNAFAAEILVPEADLLKIKKVIAHRKNKVFTWTKKELLEIAADFHVGPLVILRRLLDLGLTGKDFYNNKHSLWNRPAFGISKTHKGRDIPKETVKEKGYNYLSLAFSAYDKNKIDLKDLSDFIGVKLSYLPQTRQLLKI